ncbi:ABC transporter permease [Thermoproteota archaeon]
MSKKIALFFLIIISVSALIIPFFTGLDPNTFKPDEMTGASPPTLRHVFGTDDLGRDILLRCIYGARVSLSVGFIAILISIFIGGLVGLCSGYASKFVDEIIMRFVDFFMAIPTIFLILIIQVMLTPSIYNVMIVIGLTSWMGVSRLVRSEVLSIKERPYILAGRARGFGSFRLLFKHIFPHTAPPVIVAAMLGMGNAIIIESVLSFLGLGVQPPHASWGNMLEGSLSYMRDAPWMMLFPGLCITCTVLSLNVMGDWLRARFNPQEQES